MINQLKECNQVLTQHEKNIESMLSHCAVFTRISLRRTLKFIYLFYLFHLFVFLFRLGEPLDLFIYFVYMLISLRRILNFIFHFIFLFITNPHNPHKETQKSNKPGPETPNFLAWFNFIFMHFTENK